MGGYAVRGLYVLGEEGREFVLNTRTTKLAEMAVGGRLDQDAILAALGRQHNVDYALSGGRSGQAGPVTLEVREGAVQIHLHDVGSKDSEALLAEMSRQGKKDLHEALLEVFGS
jgi:hypothetical protein